MKRTNYLKGLLLQTTLLAIVLIFASCSNTQKPTDTKEVAEDQNEANLDTNKQENDAEFLVDAAEVNLEEIQLGQLAQQKGTSTHVKELGKMMEDAHTKSLNDLTVLAKSKMIAIPTTPTEDSKEAFNKLNEKSGIDFDKAYSDLMVNEHKDVIAAFEKASTDANDLDVKNWATVSLPDLRKHLDESIACQEKCNNM
jgi:putative membrane protein